MKNPQRTIVIDDRIIGEEIYVAKAEPCHSLGARQVKSMLRIRRPDADAAAYIEIDGIRVKTSKAAKPDS